MIQPILSNNIKNNINFSGHLTIKSNRQNEDAKSVYDMIPSPEYDIFEKGLNDLKEFIETETPEDAEFTLVLGKDDWCPGSGGTFKQGKMITFDIFETGGKHLLAREFPVTRPSGELWDEGDDFSSKLKKFLNFAQVWTVNAYREQQALNDAGKTRKPRPIWPKDPE